MVRCPGDNAGLAFITDQSESALVGAEGSELVSRRLRRVRRPVAQAPGSRRSHVTALVSSYSSKNTDILQAKALAHQFQQTCRQLLQRLISDCESKDLEDLYSEVGRYLRLVLAVSCAHIHRLDHR